jgi:hypothetical protein
MRTESTLLHLNKARGSVSLGDALPEGPRVQTESVMEMPRDLTFEQLETLVDGFANGYDRGERAIDSGCGSGRDQT